MPHNISIIIPALNAEEHISKLLDRITKQTTLPMEVIIIDSSRGDDTKEIIKNYNSCFSIVYKKLNFSFPGHARNIGVSLSKYEWVSFLDIQTLPTSDWLEKSISLAVEEKADYVSGLMVASAETDFKKIIKAITYGNKAIKTVPGSLISKKAFERTNGFAQHVRAGEDIDWVASLDKYNIKTTNHTTPTITYNGFPKTLTRAIKKWHSNSFASAKINIYKERKLIYLTLLSSLILIFAYNWNALFTDWDTNNLYFIPNITKKALACVILVYLTIRGLIKPLLAGERIGFLLPWRWILIALIGMSLDLAKAPGLIYGAYLMIKQSLLFSKK